MKRAERGIKARWLKLGREVKHWANWCISFDKDDHRSTKINCPEYGKEQTGRKRDASLVLPFYEEEWFESKDPYQASSS